MEEIDINEEQQALDVINKKFLKITADEKGKKRVMNVLIRLGYNQSVIKRAFAIYESSNG